MTKVRVEPSGFELEVEPGETVIEAAWRSGYRWPTTCYGQAECTACAMVVLTDPAQLSEVQPREEAALARWRRRDDPRTVRRLACQTKLHGEQTVVVRKPGVAPDPGPSDRQA